MGYQGLPKNTITLNPKPQNPKPLNPKPSLPYEIADPRDPRAQIISTLGPNVCNYYLHWATWIPMEKDQGTGTSGFYGPHVQTFWAGELFSLLGYFEYCVSKYKP